MQGTPTNRNGIGAKVRVFMKDQRLMQEQYPVRGYQSSVDMRLNFGMGANAVADSVMVVWPDSKFEVVTNVKANQELTLNAANAKLPYNFTIPQQQSLLIQKDIGNIRHAENQFNDFTVQPLLLNFLSRQGPCIAKADVNKDGRGRILSGWCERQARPTFPANS